MTTLRPGIIADVPAVLDLWTDLMRAGEEVDARYVLADGARDAARSWIRNDWLSGRYPFPALWVAEEEAIVAFLSITVSPSSPVVATTPTACIQDLFVHPEHRRRGLATQLVRRAREAATAAGYSRHQVGTLGRDTRAVAFWQRQGFDPMFVQMIAS